jgi:hypothetical protein
MRKLQVQLLKFTVAAALCFICTGYVFAQEPELTREQMKHFLLTAKVVKARQTQKGVTNPWRLTLSDGTLTHDGGFQSIDEHRSSKQFQDGTTEINYVDSYKYNVAAYILAEMLGVEDMMPVYVERKWDRLTGSLSWWLKVKMDEGERLKQKLRAPDQESWNRQMYRIRVFDELVYDNDANLTNVLIGEDWRIYRVDFSRAFRLQKDLKYAPNLVQIDRKFLEKLKSLDEAELTRKTKNLLTKPEIQGLMARRDKIVAYFGKLITQKGESEVLFNY